MGFRYILRKVEGVDGFPVHPAESGRGGMSFGYILRKKEGAVCGI